MHKTNSTWGSEITVDQLRAGRKKAAAGAPGREPIRNKLMRAEEEYQKKLNRIQGPGQGGNGLSDP